MPGAALGPLGLPPGQSNLEHLSRSIPVEGNASPQVPWALRVGWVCSPSRLVWL